MSEDVQLKILDSFDRMLDLFADELGYEWEYEEDCEECEPEAGPSQDQPVL